MKKEPGTDGFLLQVTNYVKDVSISVLSDDDFSKVIYLETLFISQSLCLQLMIREVCMCFESRPLGFYFLVRYLYYLSLLNCFD